MITSYWYDEENEILYLEYRSNAQCWQYLDVPKYIFEDLRSADSKGKFINANIKGHYRESRC
ncbi:MAG: KTSC domain-containing protein [Bacteroidetes bacterium]|nr:KTSC domain-containing protein [Bacteroidota bacterium]